MKPQPLLIGTLRASLVRNHAAKTGLFAASPHPSVRKALAIRLAPEYDYRIAPDTAAGIALSGHTLPESGSSGVNSPCMDSSCALNPCALRRLRDARCMRWAAS